MAFMNASIQVKTSTKNLVSLNSKKELTELAKNLCRDLRKQSTEAENFFWEVVRRKQISGKKFYRQYPIYYDITGKESFYIVDFYCRQEKLIIELDGQYHQYSLKKDKERTEILKFLGLRILRFNNDEIINNINEVLAIVKENILIKQL